MAVFTMVAVGLPVMIDVRPEKFADMLAGAALMDEHFRPQAQNLPVIMGLLRAWNRNFLGYATHGIMPLNRGCSGSGLGAAAGDGVKRQICEP